MSVKGKNLSYEAQEPSFLRKLRAQQGGFDGDRHERPVARPKRVVVEQDDDGPTYVDEASNQTLSREEYESLLSGDPESGVQSEGQPNGPDSKTADGDPVNLARADAEAQPRNAQEVTEIGNGPKKRKVGRAIGTDTAEPEDESKRGSQKKAKKKIKAVKLSFGDEPT